jgi:hypothetical protein
VIVGLDKVAGPVDVVIDLVGGPQMVAAYGLLAPGGSLQSVGWASGEPALFPPGSTLGCKVPVAITSVYNGSGACDRNKQLEASPLGAEDPDDWRAELTGRYQTVAGFLKMLPAVISFGANAEGAPVLAAMRALPGVLAYRGKLPRAADPRPADRRSRGERPLAAAGVRAPRARRGRGQPARLRVLRA